MRIVYLLTINIADSLVDCLLCLVENFDKIFHRNVDDGSKYICVQNI